MNFRIVRSCCSQRRGAAALSLLLLAGCATVRAPSPPPAPVAPPVMPVPAVPQADAMHRFVLEQPGVAVVGTVQATYPDEEDTLPDVARRFNLGFDELARANPGVDPWSLDPKKPIVLPTRFVLPDAPHEGVVINIAAMRLYYYPKHPAGTPQVVITHPIGIGRVGWRTPEGVTRIVSRQKDPVWIPPPSIRREHRENGDPLPARVPAGPDNPLGAHLFRLSWPGYLIHGTDKPYGVGMRSSHGCLRLYPEDIALLFDEIPISTPVRIVNQPFVLGWSGDSLYVQAFGPLEDDRRDWRHGPRSLLKKAGSSPLWRRIKADDERIDWGLARDLAADARGLPVSIMRRDGDSIENQVAAARRVRNELPRGATWSGELAPHGDAAQLGEVLGDVDRPASTGSALPSHDSPR
jgi:L,D-transpeptidase ErfK/SrfK